MSAVPYEYAIIRAVPRVERGELINVGPADLPTMIR